MLLLSCYPSINSLNSQIFFLEVSMLAWSTCEIKLACAWVVSHFGSCSRVAEPRKWVVKPQESIRSLFGSCLWAAKPQKWKAKLWERDPKGEQTFSCGFTAPLCSSATHEWDSKIEPAHRVDKNLPTLTPLHLGSLNLLWVFFLCTLWSFRK